VFCCLLCCLLGVVLLIRLSLISLLISVLIVLWFRFICRVSLVCESWLLWCRWVSSVLRLCCWIVFWLVLVFGLCVVVMI